MKEYGTSNKATFLMPSFNNPNIETELLLIVESRTLRRSLIWKALVVLLDAGAENEKVEFSDWG